MSLKAYPPIQGYRAVYVSVRPTGRRRHRRFLRRGTTFGLQSILFEQFLANLILVVGNIPKQGLSQDLELYPKALWVFWAAHRAFWAKGSVLGLGGEGLASASVPPRRPEGPSIARRGMASKGICRLAGPPSGSQEHMQVGRSAIRQPRAHAGWQVHHEAVMHIRTPLVSFALMGCVLPERTWFVGRDED